MQANPRGKGGTGGGTRLDVLENVRDAILLLALGVHVVSYTHLRQS
jgi:hypothetical protein